VINAPKIRKGAKGISVFILIFSILNPYLLLGKNIIIKLIIAPIQKDNTRAVKAASGLRSQPIPKINFESPNPIHFPFEINQMKAKGKASIGPDNTDESDGKVNTMLVLEKVKNKDSNDVNIKI